MILQFAWVGVCRRSQLAGEQLLSPTYEDQAQRGILKEPLEYGPCDTTCRE
jgi:hypothetical protein